MSTGTFSKPQSDGTIDQASKTPVQLAKSIEPNLADLEKLEYLRMITYQIKEISNS